MASCSGKDEQSERNRKNAGILRSHIFRHDICRVIHFGFYLYNSAKHNEQFLSDLICFTHTFLEHMEQYSKGKTLKIKTQKKRKVKKQKGRKLGNTQHDSQDEDQGDKDFDPDKPDDLSGDDDDQIDEFNDYEQDEESEKEEAVERQFNFVAEIALLVDY